MGIQQTDGRIEPEVVHDVLRNDRRRRVIQYLKQRLEPVSLRELSERVAELETSKSPPPRNIRQSVYNSLHQTHLPKLDEIGIIEYNRDRKTVELRERARDVDVYMEVITRFGISWSTYYRSLGVFSLIAVVLAETDIAAFAGIESLLVATAFLFVFAASTAYQFWTRRWFYLRALVADE
ncbi:DUF7344 domain-containing protein [Salinibaculum salinum]|uniref:DUF7344 domain-containing protein n=1 Tax=Salinibaculum salinum TaxID=3131996 RepID=UPI0030EB24A1